MLELDSNNMFGTDGSGNQKKIWINNYLYKADSKFRDSTKEVSASNFADAVDIYHTPYERLKCKIDGDEQWFCRCPSYLSTDNDKTINLYQLLDFYKNIVITTNMSTSDYFKLTVDCIADFSQLNKDYIVLRLIQMLTFDFIIANDDRHLRNIDIIIYSNGKMDIAPLFDNGHSFFRKDSMLTNQQLEILSNKHKSKPFSTNQWKNLIDINYAQQLASEWDNKIKDKYDSIMNIPGILESHKKIIRYRINKLINK